MREGEGGSGEAARGKRERNRDVGVVTSSSNQRFKRNLEWASGHMLHVVRGERESLGGPGGLAQHA